MDLKHGLVPLCIAVLMTHSAFADTTGKQGRRALHHATASSTPKSAKPYGAGLNEEQSLHALEEEISRKLGSQLRDGDYPEEARREGWSGTARVDVVVGSNGKIKEAALQRSSGFPILDQQAVRLIDRITLWWIPQRLRNREVRVTVPVGFYMRDEYEPPFISAGAFESLLAERTHVNVFHCHSTNATGSGWTLSPAVDVVPQFPPAQDAALYWTAAHSTR
jgi:TonB family protein